MKKHCARPKLPEHALPSLFTWFASGLVARSVCSEWHKTCTNNTASADILCATPDTALFSIDIAVEKARWIDTLLKAAASRGYLETIAAILHRFEVVPSHGAMEAALVANRADAVKMLLDAGYELAADLAVTAAAHGFVDLARTVKGTDAYAITAAAIRGGHSASVAGPYDVRSAEAAAFAGDLPLVLALTEDVPRSPGIVADAIAGGHVEMARSLLAFGFPYDAEALEACVKVGDRTLLEKLAETCAFETNAFAAAAMKGDVDMMRFLDRLGAPCDEFVAAAAAGKGHIAALDYLAETHPDTLRERNLFVPAASSNQLQVLRWAERRGLAPTLQMSIDCAAMYGHIEAVRWLTDRGCVPDPRAAVRAAEGGHLDIIQLLESLGCAEWKRVAITAAIYGFTTVFRYSVARTDLSGDADVVRAIFRGPDDALLDEAHVAFRVTHTPSLLTAAVKSGRLSRVSRLLSLGCPCDALAARAAAAAGRIPMMQLLLDAECAQDCSVTESAASHGHFEMLKYLRSRGVPWNATTCEVAALANRSDILFWARANGCEWSARVAEMAAHHSDVSMLRTLLTNGCPADAAAAVAAVETDNLEALQLLTGVWNRDECLDLARANESEEMIRFIESSFE